MVAGSVVDVEELRRTIFCSLLKQLLLPTYHLIPSSLFFFFFLLIPFQKKKKGILQPART